MKYLLPLICTFFSLSAGELKLEQAETMANRACKKAEELGIQITVAVVDQHGNLKTLKRMDHTPLVTLESAQMKAYTAASAPISTEKLAEVNAAHPIHAFSNIPGFLLLTGGIPLFSSSGEHIGGIGIGGGSSEQDETCAQAAISDR